MAQATGRIVPGDESDIHDEPHVEGRRITVLHIVAQVEEAGHGPKALAEEYDLSVADVYRALAYYYDHPAEMEAVRETRSENEAEALDRRAETLEDIRSGRE